MLQPGGGGMEEHVCESWYGKEMLSKPGRNFSIVLQGSGISSVTLH